MRPRRLLVALALAGILAASPASAHDVLESSSPASGESLAAAPASVHLTFSGDLLERDVTLAVQDSRGGDWTQGDPVVRHRTASIAIRPGMPDDVFEVRWRATSSDGHPMVGAHSFTVGEPTVTAPIDREPAADQRWLVGAAVAALALVGAAYGHRRRRRRTGAADCDQGLM